MIDWAVATLFYFVVVNLRSRNLLLLSLQFLDSKCSMNRLRTGLHSKTIISSNALSARRHILGPASFVCSLMMMTMTTIWGACWANNICNITKYGLWRFRLEPDSSNLVEDFPIARYIGGALGLLFYWVVVGPAKYRHSDLEKWSTRVGPF